MNTQMEQTIVGLIVAAGEARSKAQMGLLDAKKGDFDAAYAKIAEAEASISEAHKIQTSLLTMEARGEMTEMSILTVHAQDHLMTAMLAIELIQEIIELYESKED